MNIIDIKNLSFSYVKDTPVLEDVSFSLEKGQWLSILGHNGSGKSTLSKLIIGLLIPSSGEIIVDGIPLNEETVYDIRAKIGIVFQNPDNQFVGVTVEDDIAFGMENLNLPREKMISNIEEYAKKVNMSEYLSKPPHMLSGGQKQRVAIAGILAMNTDIIIFDEATSMLDPHGRDDIMNYIKELNKEGVTVITITHDMKEAVYSDKILILKEGKVLAYDDTKALLHQKDILNQSNLELLLPLKLLYKLKESYSVSKELEDALWQFSLPK